MNNYILGCAIGTASMLWAVNPLMNDATKIQHRDYTRAETRSIKQDSYTTSQEFGTSTAKINYFINDNENISNYMREISEFSINLISKQKKLDADFLNILNQDGWELYEKV